MSSIFTSRLVLLVLALAAWLVSLVQVKTSAMDQLGLVDVLPITFFVALGLLLLSFVMELMSKSPSRLMLAAQMVLLIVILHGTVPIIFPEPHYAWAYKHFGVTEYIDGAGSVNPSIDIYQNWPGFFALTAWFGNLAGIDTPVVYATWAQLFFNLCYLLQLSFLFRSFTTNERVIWIALWVFFTASWVGQDYFAPQALAFVLVLTVYAIVARWLMKPVASGLLPRIINKVVPVGKKVVDEDRVYSETSPRQRAWALGVACLCFFALTVTHQLTPYMVIAGMALLTIFGILINRTITILFLLIAVGWLIPHLPFVNERYGILDKFDPVANAQNSSVDPNQGEPGRVFVAQCARLLSATVWGLALIGVLRRLRRGRREILAVLLMLSPVVILAGQSYGGEAIYRVFLFSLPWAALLTAYAIVPMGRHLMVLRSLRTLIPLAVILTLFVPAYYGLEEINEMRTSEVEASTYFYENAELQSTLALMAPNFPLRSKGNYVNFVNPAGGDVSPSLFEDARVDSKTATPAILLEVVEDQTRALEGQQRYVVLSESQDVYARIFGELPPNSIPEVSKLMAASPNWVEFFRKDQTVIYQFVGQR